MQNTKLLSSINQIFFRNIALGGAFPNRLSLAALINHGDSNHPPIDRKAIGGKIDLFKRVCCRQLIEDIWRKDHTITQRFEP